MFNKPHRKGSPCPMYSFASICEMFRRYEKELVGKYVSDPLGTRVWFMDYNFSKLIQLQYKGEKAKASKVLQYLRSNGVDETCYSFDKNRASTLFWIPDIIQYPDSIHTNRHGVIRGDEVYTKCYAKAGAAYKIVFTEVDQRLNQRIVTTSFMTEKERLKEFVTLPAKWEKKLIAEPSEQQQGLNLNLPKKEKPQ